MLRRDNQKQSIAILQQSNVIALVKHSDLLS